MFTLLIHIKNFHKFRNQVFCSLQNLLTNPLKNFGYISLNELMKHYRSQKTKREQTKKTKRRIVPRYFPDQCAIGTPLCIQGNQMLIMFIIYTRLNKKIKSPLSSHNKNCAILDSCHIYRKPDYIITIAKINA